MQSAPYQSTVSAINKQIDTFNSFLDCSRHVAHIDLSRPETSAWIEDNSLWGRSSWPCKDSYGVYFLAGHRIDQPTGIGLYIGKASFSKRIGHRVWHHLNHGKVSRRYTKMAPDGSPFRIQMLFAVPMPSDDMGAFAPALEEHLINTFKSQLYLLNRVGNK